MRHVISMLHVHQLVTLYSGVLVYQSQHLLVLLLPFAASCDHRRVVSSNLPSLFKRLVSVPSPICPVALSS